MSNVPTERYRGPFVIDLNHLSGILLDMARGAMRGLRREQPGIEGVIEELDKEIAKNGPAAGIAPSTYARFREATENLSKIRAVRGVVDKAAEVLRESEALYEHERENAISQMADAIRSTSKREGNIGITAPFEKLLRYNSQLAEKALKSRRRNAALAASQSGDQAEES